MLYRKKIFVKGVAERRQVKIVLGGIRWKEPGRQSKTVFSSWKTYPLGSNFTKVEQFKP